MRFALVDLSHLFHRARYGAMAAPDEQMGLALLIIFRSLRKLHRELAIDHIVFAADRGSWRTKLYPRYKARRKLEQLALPLHEQRLRQDYFKMFDGLLTYLSQHTRCTVLAASEIEGDDFIARWIGRHPSDWHVIVSADTDFVQLIADNVVIYDAMNQRMLTAAGLLNDRGQTLSFQVSPKDGKIKVGNPDPQFVPEPEWWRKALFVKLIRGDASDSVFAAFPGVRYEGKRYSIRAAWDDRHAKGYDWNNLMFQTWEKLLETGERQTVTVIDEYRTNEHLIDLTQQPPEIIARMDVAIDQATDSEVTASQVGMHFLRFCQSHDLPALVKEAADHVVYLNAPYQPAKKEAEVTTK